MSKRPTSKSARNPAPNNALRNTNAGDVGDNTTNATACKSEPSDTPPTRKVCALLGSLGAQFFLSAEIRLHDGFHDCVSLSFFHDRESLCVLPNTRIKPTREAGSA